MPSSHANVSEKSMHVNCASLALPPPRESFADRFWKRARKCGVQAGRIGAEVLEIFATWIYYDSTTAGHIIAFAVCHLLKQAGVL